jgi:hypothetical protein
LVFEVMIVKVKNLSTKNKGPSPGFLPRRQALLTSPDVRRALSTWLIMSTQRYIKDKAREINKEKVRAHYAWQKLVARSDLSPTARLAAWILALHRNIQSDRCDVSYDGIAAGIGVSRRTAIRAVAEIEACGLIAVERGGGAGNRNQFRFISPAETVTELCHPLQTKTVTNPEEKGDKSDPKTVTELCHPNKKYNKKRNKKESPACAGVTDAPPVSFAVDSKKEAFNEARLESEDDGFDRWWAAYPKKVGKLEAKRAYAKAVKDVADPDRLESGAKRYTQERTGQDPKYTKNPATWLRAGCWEDEAPGDGPPIIDGLTGEEIIQPRRPTTNSGQQETLEQIGERVKANGGRRWL